MTEFHYTECHYAECCYAEGCSTECYSTELRYAEFLQQIYSRKLTKFMAPKICKSVKMVKLWTQPKTFIVSAQGPRGNDSHRTSNDIITILLRQGALTKRGRHKT